MKIVREFFITSIKQNKNVTNSEDVMELKELYEKSGLTHLKYIDGEILLQTYPYNLIRTSEVLTRFFAH